MTLSRFLRDYIYIPLGGNRKGEASTYINIMITFLLAGLWHGAGWMFVLWGGLHGLALVIHRLWEKLGIKLHLYISWFLTFNFINLTWVFFRAKDIQSANKVISSMYNFSSYPEQFNLKNVLQNIGGGSSTLIYITVSFLIVLLARSSIEMKDKFIPNVKYMLIIIFLMLYSVLSLNRNAEFLYFNF